MQLFWVDMAGIGVSEPKVRQVTAGPLRGPLGAERGRRALALAGRVARAQNDLRLHFQARFPATGDLAEHEVEVLGVIVVLLALADVDRDAIIADYLATGERLARVREALLRNETYRHLQRTSEAGRQTPTDESGSPFLISPRAIVSVLDTVEGAPGGVAGFLLANGATPEQIARWREMVIEPA